MKISDQIRESKAELNRCVADAARAVVADDYRGAEHMLDMATTHLHALQAITASVDYLTGTVGFARADAIARGDRIPMERLVDQCLAQVT